MKLEVLTPIAKNQKKGWKDRDLQKAVSLRFEEIGIGWKVGDSFPHIILAVACPAKHVDFKTMGPPAKGRFCQKNWKHGKNFALCGLLSWPENIPSELCLLDWLHAVDKGIGADIAGKILVELAPCYEARSCREQTALLWQEIQKLYNVEYGPQTLSPNALSKENQKKGAVATLKSQQQWSDIWSQYYRFSQKIFLHVRKLAKFLAKPWHGRDPEACAKSCWPVHGLREWSLRLDPESKAWHFMPKLHLFQDICDSAHKPKDYWCYQDETTGGFLAKLLKRRGGKNNPRNNAANCLLRWQSLTRFPALHSPLCFQKAQSFCELIFALFVPRIYSLSSFCAISERMGKPCLWR